MKTIFLFIILLFTTSSVISQRWPVSVSQKDHIVFTSPYGPRNLGNDDLRLPWECASPSNCQSGLAYDYDFHGGLDIAKVTNFGVQSGSTASVVAIESGEVVEVVEVNMSPNINKYIVIKHDVGGNVYYYWKYFHMTSSLTQGSTVVAGQKIGEILPWPNNHNRSHLDVRYYPNPQNSLTYNDVDNTDSPIHSLQNSLDLENITYNNGTDDEYFGIVTNQTNPSTAITQYDLDELAKENNVFSDARGDYIFFGIRTDKNELDFKNFEIIPYGYYQGNSLPVIDYSILESDFYANSEISTYPIYYNYPDFDSYAERAEINYGILKYNVGDMDGDNDGVVSFEDSYNRYDNGAPEFNDIEVIPRELSSGDPYHTVYVKFYINLAYASSVGYEFVRFNLELLNTDGGTFSDGIGDLDSKSIYVFDDSSLEHALTLNDGDKAVVLDKLVMQNGGTLTLNTGSVLYLNKQNNQNDRTEIDVKPSGTLQANFDSKIIMDEYSYMGGNSLYFYGDVIRGRYTEINADYNGKIVIGGDFDMNTLGQCLMTTDGGVIEIDGDLNISDGSFLLSNTNNPGKYIVNGDIYAEGSGNPNTGYVIDLLPGTDVELGYNNKITIADGSKMRAVGTLSNPVTFTYDGIYDPTSEAWDGIELRGDGNIFEYTILEHALTPLYFRSKNNIVEYSTIRNNLSYGIRTNSDYSGGQGSLTITDSNIHDNGSHGVYVRNTNAGIQYSDIKDNDGDGLYVYSSTIGNPNTTGSEYFRGNDISGNGGNAIELAYNATLYDGYTSTEGNNDIYGNDSHEIYLSSSNARWYDATGGSYTAVGDNTSSKFVYNLAQTTSGESTVSWTVGMENNAWNYATPSASKFYGSVDYTPYQTSQMFGSTGPRGTGTPSEMNGGELPQLVLSVAAVQSQTSGLTSDSEKDAYLEHTREINNLIATINSKPTDRMVAKNLNGLLGYYNQLPAAKKQEFSHVPELLTGFISDRQLARELSFGGDGTRLTSETALMLQIHQQLQDGDAQGSLNAINKYEATFSNLDIKRELGFIKASALEQLAKYQQAIQVYDELGTLSKLGIDPENTATDYATLITSMEDFRDEQRGKEGTSGAVTSSSNKAKEVVETDKKTLPASFVLNQAYPNPFNPSTVLSFDLPETGKVRVEVYNITGQLVSVLTNQRFEAGSHSLQFNADGLASGVYLVRANLAGTIQSQKVTLIK